MGRPKLDRKQIQSRVDAEVYEWLAKDGIKTVSKAVEKIILKHYEDSRYKSKSFLHSKKMDI